MTRAASGAERWPLRRRVWIAALAAYGVLLYASAPRWPDDWDGIGFVESIFDFDLARFHPHPPGYPVYVALLRCAFVLVRDPMAACAFVAAASGVATLALVSDALWRATDVRTAAAASAVLAVMPLSWRSCSGVGTEGPALACAAGCAWGWVACRQGRSTGAVVLGLAAGVGLGIRLSWAPLYVAVLAMAPRGARIRSWGLAVVATSSWAASLFAIVGPRPLMALTEAHFAGHAERWGGTIATEPGLVRVEWLARDILVDALGCGGDVLGVLLGVLVALTTIVGLRAWRRTEWHGWRAALAVVAPYVAWIAVGQNLRDQPRHVLPLAAALAVALGLAARASRATFGVVSALAVTLSIRTAMDAAARRTIPPPGQQLVDLVAGQPSPKRMAVFGGASVRFFEGTNLSDEAFVAGSLGDAQLWLTRLDRLPARVWLTSEVDTRNQLRQSLTPVTTLCRPPRIDRRAPCIDVFDWKLPYLPSH